MVLILNQIAGSLKKKFRSLQQSKQWTAADTSKSGAFFKASGPPSRSVEPKQPPALPEGWTHPNTEWQAWFDRQTCDICKKPHPTKYHTDPERRNRPFKISSIKSGKQKRVDTPRNKLRVKKGQKEEFKKRVYNLFECLDENDNDSADSGGEEVEQHVNIADAEGADDEPSYDANDDDDDSPASHWS